MLLLAWLSFSRTLPPISVASAPLVTFVIGPLCRLEAQLHRWLPPIVGGREGDQCHGYGLSSAQTCSVMLLPDSWLTTTRRKRANPGALDEPVDDPWR